ncbi:hypothetical protein YN1HA_4570 [Sulfurisphaera ohwakuensis]
MREFYLFSLVRDIMIKTLQKASQNFCFVYKFETLSPFTAIGSSGSLFLKGTVRKDRALIYSNFKRKVSFSLKEGKIVIGKEEEYSPFDFSFQDKLVEKMCYWEKEAICVTHRNKVKVRIIDGKNVLSSLSEDIKNQLSLTLFNYFKREVGYTFDKPITLYKIIISNEKVYLQFVSNWSFWYVNIEEFAKKDYSLIPLIRLSKEIKETLNR